MDRRPRRLARSSRGIAEIVGTLMLVLIVVAAAVALAAFIASYQKQLQAQQAESQQRSLESLKVLSIVRVTPEASPNQLDLSNFSFMVASEFVNPSSVEAITVNGNPLAHYLVTNISAPSGGTPDCLNDAGALNLSPFQVVEVTVNDLPTGPCANGFFTSAPVLVDSFLKVSLFTVLQNTFTAVFLPPTAVPMVGTTSEFTGSTYRNVPLLDGSTSFQTGNGSIVQWNWTIVNTTAGASPTPVTVLGEKVVAPFASSTSFAVPPTYTFNVTLQVENSNGLLDISTLDFAYVVP